MSLVERVGASLNEPISPGRRKLIGRSLALASTLFVGRRAVQATQRELEVGREGIKTENARIYPLYYSWDGKFDPRDIPSNLDFYYDDFLVPELMSASYDNGEMIDRLTDRWTTQTDKLDQFINDETTFALGNVYTPVSRYESRALTAIEGTLGGYSAWNFWISRKDELHSRRDLMLGMVSQTAKAAVAVWGLSPVVTQAPILIDNARSSQEFRRMTSRPHGMQGVIHFEDLSGKMQDAFQAAKIHGIARRLSEERGREVRGAIVLSGYNSGVEHYLRHSEDHVLNAIWDWALFFPSVVLLNETVSYLCSTYELTPPKSYKSLPAEKRNGEIRAGVVFNEVMYSYVKAGLGE